MGLFRPLPGSTHGKAMNPVCRLIWGICLTAISRAGPEFELGAELLLQITMSLMRHHVHAQTHLRSGEKKAQGLLASNSGLESKAMNSGGPWGLRDLPCTIFKGHRFCIEPPHPPTQNFVGMGPACGPRRLFS